MLFEITQKLLLKIDPERAHDLTLGGLSRTANTPLERLYRQQLDSAPVSVMGLEFDNPVGLAAGLDKNGEAIDAFYAMGFGHVEVGTVTPRGQAGNPAPRLFRIVEKQAIINRMGFNNQGVDHLVTNLKAKKSPALVGVNIGKNRDTPVEDGKLDYLHCMQKVYAHAAYITVNISSPNTPGLRSLQYGELLDELLATLKQEQGKLAEQHGRYVPLALKIAPDLDADEIASIADSLLRHNFDGVIATNTTLDRKSVAGMLHADQAGGLSGAPLLPSATAVVAALHSHLGDKLPIIGVGGILSGEDAAQKFAAGASLVQVYSGFIYRGPALIKQIVDRYNAR